MSVFQSFHWRISTFVWVDKNGVSYTWIGFLTEEYTPLYKLTKLVFSTLKNIFYLKNILLFCECFIEEYLHLCELNKMAFSTPENIFYLKNKHLSLSAFKCFWWKYLPLCELTKIVFLRLKILSTRRIYTSMQNKKKFNEE